TLRMVIAALLLAPVARPKIHNHTRSDWISVLELAVCLGGLNICIYYALSHLPIGVAVTVEFLGPLTLAALGSRSWRDGIAILLALTGVATVWAWDWPPEPSGACTSMWPNEWDAPGRRSRGCGGPSSSSASA
ncbi:EamA family transporter, partial [Cutibacterium acnes]